MSKSKELSRKAKRRGKVYCAPFCGAGCTWAAYQKAKKGAKALAKLLGAGWKPEVWENLGWHYCVVNQGLKVHANQYHGQVESYTAFLGDPGSPGGRWAEHGKTPKAAIRKAVKKARWEINHLMATLEAAGFSLE